MKHLFTTMLIFAMATLASKGQTKQYELNVGDFKEFTVVNSINVRYVASADSAGMARFECSPKVASAMVFSNNKFKLKIELSDDIPADAQLPEITIYSTFLDKVQNWGDSTVTIASVTPCAEFNARVMGNGEINIPHIAATEVKASISTGSGRIYVAGKTAKASLSNVGTGSIEAAKLVAETVNAKIVGTGAIDCNPSADLSISGMGSGKVYYTGTPKIKNRSIGIKAIAIE